MTRHLFLAAFAMALAGCGFRVAPADGSGGGGGGGEGGGGGGAIGTGIVGSWSGRPTIVEADGQKFTPEVQAQLAAHIPALDCTFTPAGAVTMTVNGNAMTFARPGDIAIGGDPINGVVDNYELKSLNTSATRVELQLWNRSGKGPGDWRDNPVRDDTQLSVWTFTLNGDRLDMRCVGNTRSNLNGRQSRMVMVATLTRAGGAGGGAPGGGW
jgi:hypothetical protein